MKKVLIIDDEEMVRRTLKNKFPSNEYEVFEAKSVDEAFGVLVSEPVIDVVIVDLRLEQTDEEGRETGLRAIKPSMVRRICESKRRLTPTPIVIVLTGYPNISSCKKAMKEGAYDYLDKNDPNVYNKLVNSIEQGLKERGITSEEYKERKWLEEHFDEVVSKYKGKRIAIYKEEVIAAGETIDELNKELTKILLADPQIKPFLVSIPKLNITPGEGIK